MKITQHWLREFVPTLQVPPAEVAKRLTLAGLEVESMAPVAPPFSGVVVGEVLEVARHPNAEKLSLCVVTTDGTDRLQIICGAPNVRADTKVAVAKVGSHLPGGVAIRRAKLRGIESHGMLCSARELGLGQEHVGILELPVNLQLGIDVRTALDLDDTSFEVNATPNRGDCMSVFGIARDYAAAHEGRYLTYRVPPVTAQSTEVVSVTMAAPGACPVFGSRIVRGLDIQAESPAWLRERLRRVGINSISPIVDVTNYVMMESGQPMHAYDLARVSGGISVRMARPGERVTLLDDKEYALDPDFLVIADANAAIGLAGIMGGRDSAISESTTDVLFEAAHFTPDGIAGKARRVGLFTDAAQRFERGVDPTLPAMALERASALLMQIAGGTPGPVQLSRGEGKTTAESTVVHLRRKRLTSLLGVSVPDAEVQSLLAAVTGAVQTTPDGWSVLRPAHRFDIRIEPDLIEEIARLRGFDSIVESHAVAPQVAGYATEARVDNDRVLLGMADAGYREVITYSFVDPVLQRRLFPDTPALALANAISSDLSEMRVSLWTGLIQAAQENLRRQQSRIRLFEIGKKFELRGAQPSAAMHGESLHETETLAGIASGARLPEQWGSARDVLDFYDIKADVMRVLELTGSVAEFRFEPDSHPCLRPGRTARILRESIPVGWLGEIHPQLTKALSLSTNMFLFEVEMKLAFVSKSLIYTSISKFPSIRRDLSIVVDERVPLAVLQENVTVSASGLLSELKVFDVYRGPGLDFGRKSIALGLILQDSSRTLTDVDADVVVTAVVTRLRDELSASIRDQ